MRVKTFPASKAMTKKEIFIFFALVAAFFLIFFWQTFASGYRRTGSMIIGSYSPTYGEFVNFQSNTNIKFDSFLWYSEIGQSFDTNLGANLAAQNQSLQLAWEPWQSGLGPNQPSYTLKSIASGNHDVAIKRWAQELKAYGRPVYFRPMSEMNSDWVSWGGKANGNVPSDYIPAWRHLHDIFVSEGATNVKWVWSVNNQSYPSTSDNAYSAYFPGDNYIDYMGISGYNQGGTDWKSFSQVFVTPYNALTRLSGKPIIIIETACVSDSRKADWIRGMVSVLNLRMPQVAQIYWFNASKEKDWRINSSAESLAAFKKAIVDLKNSRYSRLRFRR